MTGFGKGEIECEECLISIEVRSVNHRFLDVSFKLPTIYSNLEHRLGKLIKGLVRRGRVDVLVCRKDKRVSDTHVKFNNALFGEYIDIGKDIINSEILSECNLSKDSIILQVISNALNRREIVEFVLTEQHSIEKEYELVEQVFEQALSELTSMRRIEGEVLITEIKEYIDTFEDFVAKIELEGNCAAEVFKSRLEMRLNRYELNVNIDEQRLAQEVAILAERADYSEEIVRLKSHLTQFRDTLVSNGGGRKLDFLTQEFLREINTIGSKAQSPTVSSFVVESKVIVEKIREQVQNIE